MAVYGYSNLFAHNSTKVNTTVLSTATDQMYADLALISLFVANIYTSEDI